MLQVHTDLASAAESGWDFSTRWFAWEGAHRHRLSSINTTNIIPLDLNVYLCWNLFLLSKFASVLGEHKSLY